MHSDRERTKRKAACSRAVVLALSLGAMGSFSGSSAAAIDVIQAVGFSYDVDAALTYIDALQHLPAQIAVTPWASGAKDAAPSTGTTSTSTGSSSTPSQPRTVGLRRLRLGLSWQAPHSTSLNVVLRPDAVNREYEAGSLAQPPREFDDRSGDPGMKPMPTIRLLDAYQVSVNAGPEMNVALGVWEGFGETARAYPELLGFGLTVLFPAKFSAVRLGWHLPNTGPDTAAAPGLLPSNLSVSAYVYEGDEDRAESLVEKHGAFDVAPSAHDPYHGGAVVVRWQLRPELSLGLLGGYLQQADTQGSYDASFVQFSGDTRFHLGGQETRLSLDSRYELSHGRGGVADQNLLSVTGTGMVGLAEQLWGVVGVSGGRGARWTSYMTQRQTTVNLSGYQFEGGILHSTGRNLSLELMVTHEYRTMRSGGLQTGGFQDSGGNQSTIHRVGLELTYLLNQNA